MQLIVRLSLMALMMTLVGSAHAQEQTRLGLDCLLQPHMIVNVGTPVPGVLASVNADRGDVVKRGSVLARIDSRSEKAAVETAKARADFAARRMKRNQELYQDDLLSGQEKDEVETERQMTRLELQEREAQLSMRTIVSPINGVVVERVKSPGEFVHETELMQLAQIDPLNVEVVVPVGYFGSIAVGSTAEVTAASPVGGTYTAKVTVVDKVIDAASDTFGVRLEIPNRDLRIPAGLRCTVSFPID